MAFSDSVRSLWHAMTTNDRHASYTSPYRSGRHVALSGSNHAPLTSVVTDDAMQPDDYDKQGFTADVRPSSRGMRGMQSPLSAQDTAYSANGMAGPDGADVPMQSFQQGLPPPPPVSHSWTRMDRWLEDNYEELFENLCEGCTQNDMNELEQELDCTLPQEVRDSWQLHDGQERGGRPTGVLFGCMLLDCEEIVQEWNQWRRTNDEFFSQHSSSGGYSGADPQPLPKALGNNANTASIASSSASNGTAAHGAQGSNATGWRREFMARQDSQPPNACQKAYIHPAWIPLARDWGGNNICIDLAPGPAGSYGQVILMGRDYDCKYVIARSWSAFLATVADDMSTNKWYIDEDTQELRLREFPKQPNVSPAYMDILRWRADQKYGPRFRPAPPAGRAPKRQSLKVDSGVKDQYASLNGFSPYASGSNNSGKSPGERMLSPPRSGHGKAVAGSGPTQSIPLARVTEESGANTPHSPVTEKVDKLVTIDSPVIGTNIDDDKDGANHFDNEKKVLAAGVTGQVEEDGMKPVPL